jgi:recombination protein RecA
VEQLRELAKQMETGKVGAESAIAEMRHIANDIAIRAAEVEAMNPDTMVSGDELGTVLAQIEQQLTSQTAKNSDFIPLSVGVNGTFLLGAALCSDGLPRGQVVEVTGPKLSKKLRVALQIVAGAQKAGSKAVFVDVLHSFNPVAAARIGVDLRELLVARPDSYEQTMDIIGSLVGSGGLDVIVVDSIEALAAPVEVGCGAGSDHMATRTSEVLAELTAIVSNSPTCLLFT